MRAKCQNCGLVLDEDDLKEIRHLSERVAPGEEMPSGECPQCGAVCHPTNAKVKPIKLRLILDVAYGHHGEEVSNLKEMLQKMVETAMGDGHLTGEGPAEVDEWTVKVAERR